MKRRAKRTLLVLLTFLFTFFFTSQDQTVTAAEGKTYIVATDTTYAPFEFQTSSGELVGIDIDLLETIAEDQGFQVEWQVLGFNAAVQALESGQADAVMAGMTITEERQETFDFTDPYFEGGPRFMVPADSPLQSMEDLEGQNVAVKTGTAGMDFALSHMDEFGFTITNFDDTASMFEDVATGNSVAVVEDYPVAAYAINTGQLDYRFLSDLTEDAPYGVAVRKGENPEFIQAFNEGLADLQASGEYDEIVNNYLGEEALANAETTTGFFSLIAENWRALLSGLWTTVWMTFVSFAIAIVIGVIMGLFRTGDNGFLSGLAQVYIDIIRGIPMIVLSFFVYFGIPQFTGWTLTATTAGLITLSLNAGAYLAEIVRGGIQAVDKGQMEAAASLGLPRNIAMRKVVLPQAFKIMVPSFINQFVITMKDTSILSVIGLVELTQTGSLIIARTYQSGNVWLIVGLMYLIIITLLTKLSARLERELN